MPLIRWCRCHRLAAASAILAWSAPAGEPRPLLPPDGVQASIRLPSAPTPAERRAAAELATALSNMTGRAIAILPAETSEPAAIELAFDPSLGPEEYRLAWSANGSTLRITGGRPRGVLYGAIGLLHDHLGCRWYTREVTRIPTNSRPVLPADLDQLVRPAFEYREVFWTEAFDGDWAMRNRLNSSNARLREEHGGRVVWGRFVHTFEQILNPAEHFDAHPDWFSMVNGRRIREHTQLCLTHPEVRRIAVETVRRWIRERPDATIFSVSQNDWYNPCQCPSCAALDEAEGSHAGSLLDFVNHVAAAIEPDHPGILIETLAYQYTRRPPRTIRPRPNVIIRLCSIECCFAHPLDGCPDETNRAFMEDLRGWQRIAPRLYVWDYTTDFAHYLLPFPNLDVLAPNVRTFAAHGVTGVFEQGNYSPGGGGELAELRSWVLAQLLWNPSLDGDALIQEFVRAVYGPSAPHVTAYLDSRRRLARESGAHVRIFDGPDRPDLAPAALVEWDNLLRLAEEAAAGDAALATRIERLRIPVWYALLHSRADVARRPEAARRLADAVRRHKLTHLRETTRDIAAELSAIELEGSRRPAAAPPGVLRGEDDALSVVFLGTLARRVPDSAAEDGIAVEVAGHTVEWLVQWAPPQAASGVTYRASARLRIEPGGSPTNRAVQLGIYDRTARRGLAHRVWRAEELEQGAYTQIELPPVVWTPGAYVWLAPCGDTNAAIRLWVDRLDLLPGGPQ